MLFRRTKMISWWIVAWFALLQAISPFIHGHIEINSPAQDKGLHIHAEEFGSSIAAPDHIPTFKNANDPTHVIVVDKALLKDIEQWLSAVLLLVFIVHFFQFTTPRLWLRARTGALPRAIVKLHHRPRAPPYR
jgi:hypothetical protein